MAMLLDIADAVVEEINGGGFAYALEATRAYRARLKAEDLADMELHITVVPKDQTWKRGTRADDECDYVVDVGIQQKFKVEGPDELDPLMTLVQSIGDHFSGIILDTDPKCSCVHVANMPYIQEHMKTLIFTSVLTFTFKCWRENP